MDKKFEHGESYEIKILANLVNDEDFLIRVIDPLKPDYFTFSEHEWMMEYVAGYYLKYSSIPTYETVLIELKDQKLRKSVRDPIIILSHKIFQKYKKYTKDGERIQEDVIRFCKTRAFENAAIKTAELAPYGKFDQINQLWEEARLVGEQIYLGVDLDDLEDRKHNEVRKNVKPLFSEAINKRIGGGLGEGEFIVIIAPMGAGKTMIVSRQAAFNRINGTNTLVISLELNERKIRQRIDACLLDKELDETKDPKAYEEEIANRLKILNNGSKVIIEKHSASGTTAANIRNRIKILESKGIEIHHVIIDYLDVMDCVDPKLNYKKDWEKFEYVSRDIYNMCQEMGVGVLGLVQGNTTSIDAEVISAKSTSGGAKRLHPADVIIGYARPPHFKQQERGNFSFIKSRFGKDGFVLPAETNYDKAEINVLDKESYMVDEEQTTKEVDAGIKNKWSQYKNKKPETSEL